MHAAVIGRVVLARRRWSWFCVGKCVHVHVFVDYNYTCVLTTITRVLTTITHVR